jgi:protoheme IX farnesyltransferase
VVVGKISRQSALIYGILLGLIGLAFIAIWTNFLTVLLGIAGWLAYVVLYTRAKRHTTWSTVLGSISGAIPPVVGYAAASGRLDLAAFLLFLILVIWQMPHFYAIGIYRYDDYKAAGIPIVPVREGISRTKRTMFLYIFAFAIVAPLLAVYGYVGATYFIISLACGIAWLGFSIAGFWVKNDAAWARKMFYLSILVMTILFFTIAINSLISVFYAGTR